MGVAIKDRGTQFVEPRQQICWDFYVDPASVTFGNAYRSALRAGYLDAQARNITLGRWWKEKAKQLERRGHMLSNAEKALDKTLKYITEHKIKLPGGKSAVLVNHKLLAVQVDAAKHVTRTLGKDQGWAERVEHSGKDGAALPTPIMFNINVQRNNGDKKDNGLDGEDKSGTRRNLGEQDSIDSLMADSSGSE